MADCPFCGTQNLNEKEHSYCYKCGGSISGATGQLDPDVVLENRYVIAKTLGRGGMGAVYQARDLRLNIPVAIKEMSTSAVIDGGLEKAVKAFEKEAALLVSLKHQSLPRVTDFFSSESNRWYLVMDYIEGQTLKQLVEKRGPIPENEVLDWAKQLCNILDYLHNQIPPVIFRDLKPSNIMLSGDGSVKLIDFGIARHFRPGVTSDTLAYGSVGFTPPEQYGKQQTDARSDIYSLGVTLHYLLTGTEPEINPFCFEPPSSYVSVSADFEKIVMKALEFKPGNRPQSAAEMLSELNTLGEKDAGVPVRPAALSDDTVLLDQSQAELFEKQKEAAKRDAVKPAAAETAKPPAKEKAVVKEGVSEKKAAATPSFLKNKLLIAAAVITLIIILAFAMWDSGPPQEPVNRTGATAAQLLPPEIDEPKDGAALESSDIVVKWQAVSEAEGYKLSLADTTKNDEEVFSQEVDDTEYTIQAKMLTPGHQYKLSVASQKSGQTSEFKSLQFTVTELGVPVIVSPRNNAQLDKGRIRVAWTPVPGASYQVAVKDLATNGNVPWIMGTGTEAFIEAGSLTEKHSYRIWLGAKSQSGKMTDSSVTVYIKEPATPGKGGGSGSSGGGSSGGSGGGSGGGSSGSFGPPTITVPRNNATVFKKNVTVVWNSVPGANYYTYRVVDFTNGKTIVNRTTTTRTQFTISSALLVAGTKYEIVVTADNRQMQAERKIYIVTLSTPVIYSPSPNNPSLTKGNITVEFYGKNGGDYRYSVKDINNNSTVIPITPTSSTTFVIPGYKLVSGHQYKIWVSAKDSTGNAAECTGVFTVI